MNSKDQQTFLSFPSKNEIVFKSDDMKHFNVLINPFNLGEEKSSTRVLMFNVQESTNLMLQSLSNT